jgi:type II secretory pathway pseudopilin PulG
MSRAHDHRRTARSPVPLRIADGGLRIGRKRSSSIRNPQSAIRIQPRSGLTLIEMLMATAITLLMMAAIVNLFATMTSSISSRRAVIELNSQLRQVRQRLALDLAGCTVPPGDQGLMPWRQRPGEAIGYFEIVEGNRSDYNPSQLIDGTTDQAAGNFEIDYTISLIPGSQTIDPEGPAVTDASGLGDHDDILALTVRSLEEPFVAIVGGNNRVESNLAEVIWYAREIQPVDDPATMNFDETRLNPYDPNSTVGEPGMRTIYRRVLIIAPWLGDVGNERPDHISAHLDPSNSGRWIANTLADVTRREYRFAHEYDLGDIDLDFPHELDLRDVGDIYDVKYAVLNDALAFDVRVFDPGAPLYDVAGVVVDPGDRAWRGAVTAGSPPVGFGAYCDLGWNDLGNYVAAATAPLTMFQQERQVGWTPNFAALGAAAANTYRGTPAVYDTWTWHYENDGRDQDDTTGNDNYDDQDPTTGMIDEGRNGVDDLQPPAPGTYRNGVDDIGERETSPPYPVPLRGVKVLLRTYERDARQVREVSVTNSFVP